MKILILMILTVLISCEKSHKKSSQTSQNASGLYTSALTVKVYYEDGAEPYTDSLPLNYTLWDVLRMNLEALMEGRGHSVTVPKSLSEMTKISNSNTATWSVEDILTLSKSYPATGNTFSIFFVNGRAAENANIIGFHISNTKVMAIFKDVIKSTGTTETGLVPKYVEQSTLVHEMGHAMGLVNNGVPMKTAHQDTANGAHCSDPNCVMYHQNEGLSSLINYAKNAVQKGTIIMYDSQCLNDARNYQK